MNPNIEDIFSQYKASNPQPMGGSSMAPSTEDDWYSGVKSGAYRTASPEIQKSSPSFGERVSGDIQGAGEKIANTIQDNSKPVLQRGLEATATAMGTPLKVSSEVLPQSVREGISKVGEAAGGIVNWLGDKIGNTKLAQDFVTNHPDAAKALESIANVGKPAGEIAGDILAVGGGTKVAETVAPKIKQGVTDLATKGKEAIMGTPMEQAAKHQGGVLKAIKENEATMTPTDKEQAIKEGRQTITKTKTGGTSVDYTPSKEIERASQLLSDTVTPKDTPDIVFQKTKNKITELSKGAEKYLEENSVKITNKEHGDMFGAKRAEAEKYLTESQLKAYDEQVKMFSKQLVGRGGYNTSNYYKALKDYEANVADRLPRGGEALREPTGIANANVRAASDVRSVVRDMLGEKHPDFKPQMYDLMSLYKAKDIALQNASKVKSKTFFEQHPNIKTAAKAAIGGATLLEGGKKVITGSF